eukprot:9469445-Pyramimonas_sp.AAC.1
MQGSHWERAVRWPLACSWLVSAPLVTGRVPFGLASNSMQGSHWGWLVRWPLACSCLVSASTGDRK